MEMVPAELATQITGKLTIPTIGIGAGPNCDAQVLVWQDMAGMTSGKTAKFVKRFGDVGANCAAPQRNTPTRWPAGRSPPRSTASSDRGELGFALRQEGVDALRARRRIGARGDERPSSSICSSRPLGTSPAAGL